MNQNAFWKYYRDFNFYNIIFSVLIGVIFDPVTGFLNFLSFGMFIGYLGFNYFRKNEYFLYYNLGLSKSFLLKKVFTFNLIFGVPILVMLFLLL